MNSLVALPLASALPVAAPAMTSISPVQAITHLLAAADAEVIAAGEKFEPLLGKYLTAQFKWAALSRAAHAEAREKFGDDYSSDGWSKPLPGKSPGTAYLSEAHKRNGCDRASDAVHALCKEMEPLAETIKNADVTCVAGLRAKTLVAIWDCQPLGSHHEGCFDFDNQESHRSLFTAAVALTGLSDMVSSIDTRLQADATISHEDA
jgi:hypothetical protein